MTCTKLLFLSEGSESGLSPTSGFHIAETDRLYRNDVRLNRRENSRSHPHKHLFHPISLVGCHGCKFSILPGIVGCWGHRNSHRPSTGKVGVKRRWFASSSLIPLYVGFLLKILVLLQD